jgi:hypothetical protein
MIKLLNLIHTRLWSCMIVMYCMHNRIYANIFFVVQPRIFGSMEYTSGVYCEKVHQSINDHKK